MSAVGRQDLDSGRWYVDPVDPDLVYESVTTILSAAQSQPWLAPWSAKLAAEYAVDHLEDILRITQTGGRDAAVEEVKGAARRLRELKADIGTHQHDILEAILLDQPLPDVPNHLVDVEIEGERVDHDALSDGLINFLTDYDIDPLLAEATVANVVHGYAGTLDLLARFGPMRLPGLPDRPLVGLVDLKTGRLKPEARAQQAAYRRGDEVWVDRLGNKAPLPHVDFTAVLHVRPEYERGYKLLRLDEHGDAAAFDWFLACQRVLRHQQAQPKLAGSPLYPPLPDGSQPPPLLEDLEHDGFARARAALSAAGVRSLADLADLTAAEARALRGIGPKTLTACASLLAHHGLTFATTQEGAVA